MMASYVSHPQVVMVVTSHGGHLGWCDRGSDREGGPEWVERVACGFLETALELDTDNCLMSTGVPVCCVDDDTDTTRTSPISRGSQ